MRKPLESLYKVSLVNFIFCKSAIKSKIKVNPVQNIKMLKKGFYGESKVIYQLNNENTNLFFSDYDRLKSRFINDKYSVVLNNKIIFERTFKDDIAIPKNFALITKGNIVRLDGSIRDFDSLISYIKKNEYVVLKPISGGGGVGILIVKYQDDRILVNNKEVAAEELAKSISKLDDYFISEFIEQGEFATRLNPSTLNSMRIVTMIDPATNQAFIPIAVQRIGTKKSAPADNWTQGGISAEIDLATGVIKKGATYPTTGQVKWHEFHPDTNAPISGQPIPKWDEIKQSILSVANAHPYVKYIGWDVVLTDEGIKVIEGNSCSDVNLLQIHRPILKDEKVKSFYRYHGVIK